jgi:seryl-tRNA synthetase
MVKVTIPIVGVDKEYLSQLEYALAFASEEIESYSLSEEDLRIDVEVKSQNAVEGVRQKIQELVQRYQQREFGLQKNVQFKQERDLPVIDAWKQMVERKWVGPVGEGHVILRGAAATLVGLIDSKVDRLFADAFGAEREIYPSTIRSQTLDRCKHFTSFPEHIDFVAHLRRDLDVLNGFTQDCRDKGWAPGHHRDRMADSEFAISPSCCYHCYEGMEGWRLEAPGRCTTMVLGCHRYEGANHKSLSRLNSFTMREVVWVGHPRFVIEARAKAEDLIMQWAKDWELTGTFETANDMFFTEDYAVKASFQRQQQAKKELRLRIPFENQDISVFSSNFHAQTFGKAFNISLGERPATSGCIGWGYERWIYAIFSQFGLDISCWPAMLRDEFEAYRSQRKTSNGKY